jgi:hypothetical protein
MASLYELSKEGAQLYSLLESGEIDEQTFKDSLEAIGADEKFDTYCGILAQLKADTAMYKAEEERLSRKRESAENSIKRMKSALCEFMDATGRNKVKTALWTATISPTSSVKITDEEKVPSIFRTPQPDKIDKQEIARALKAGTDVPGTVLEIGTKITIR